MRPAFFLLLAFTPLLPAHVRAAEPSYQVQQVSESITVPTTANRRYLLLMPEGVGEKKDHRFPLVVYLHGAGSKGSDTLKPAQERLPGLLLSPELRRQFPCFVLVPQCRDGEDASGRPNNWVKWLNQKDTKPAEWLRSEDEPGDQLRAAMAALDDVLARHPVDTTRVYLTGVSMGGSGTWWWASHAPRRFAAVITACGLSEVARATSLTKIPLWAFHGSNDEVAPVQRSHSMIAAIKAAGGKPRFTEYTGAGHGIEGKVFTQDNHAVLRWMFEQRTTP